jgi:hypothetical protein
MPERVKCDFLPAVADAGVPAKAFNDPVKDIGEFADLLSWRSVNTYSSGYSGKRA